MTYTASDLPEPSQQEQKQSQNLIEKICAYIDQQNGRIGFDEFMQIALYDPEYGYYSKQSSPFGAQGDFITAPEASPVYAYTLAHQCLQILQNGTENHIMEIGAGSGVLASNILSYLDKHAALPGRYTIVEQSAALRNKQRDLFVQQIPHLIDRIQWSGLNQIPEFSGVILANELFDALPFKRIAVSEFATRELMVAYNDAFIWVEAEEDQDITEYYQNYITSNKLTVSEFQTELHTSYMPLLSSIEQSLKQGVLLIIDYGCSATDYYYRNHQNGTMRCFYHHRIHDEPFINIGYQDITCDVQFSTLAQMAMHCGFKLAGYTTQGNFLLGNRIDEIYNKLEVHDKTATLKLAQEIKTLTMPDEMGERFKVMGLVKNFNHALDGFSFNDHSYTL